MATKNLARTVVEPARRGWFKWMQHTHLRAERHAVKAQLRAIRNADDALEAGCLPSSDSEWNGEGTADRLGPMYRFLRARAERPWDDVFAELCHGHDRRTLKGWHLVTLHIVREVDRHPEYSNLGGSYQSNRFTGGPWVDRRGILRWTPWRRWG